MKRILSFCILLINYPGFLSAQTFSNIAFDIGVYHQYTGENYGGGMSFYDWNKDGWDDLTLVNSGGAPDFYLNTGGTFEHIDPFISLSGQTKALFWVDYDNDGDPDISVTSFELPFQLFNNDGDFNFTEISDIAQIPDYEHETFSHSWGDYDNDGFLDVYIANYNFFDGVTNYMFRNKGDGTFEDVTTITNTSNNANFSFQGVFIDYNDDGWNDLFVINDRANSKNFMYQNFSGVFTDVSPQTNLAQNIYSMSNSWCDYDNDGDFDVYIANNIGNLLHRNDNSFFPNVAQSAGVYLGDFSWASTWVDYNNDGWKDLYVCVTPFWLNPGQNRFFVNNGDGTFADGTDLGFTGSHKWSHNNVRGDFNNDGAYDIAVSNSYPSSSDFWLNSGNDNNYVKITLEGVLSNKDAIGSKIRTYTGDLHQLDCMFAGEGYMSQHSQHLIIGLGQAEVLDSLVITWPLGLTETYYNLPVNQNYNITEGGSFPQPMAETNTIYMCEGGYYESNPGDFESYLWSDGSSEPSLIIDSPGTYFVTVTNEFGFTYISDTIFVLEPEVPQLSSSFQNPTCAGGSDGWAEINLPELPYLYTITWENGSNENLITELSAGLYNYTLNYSDACEISGSVELVDALEIQSTVESSNSSCFGANNGIALFTNSNGTGIAQILIDGIESPNPTEYLAPGIYEYVLIDEQGCEDNGSFSITEPEELSISLSTIDANEISNGSAEIIVSGGFGEYVIAWSTEETGFMIDDLTAGIYDVLVTDENGCTANMAFEIEFIQSVIGEKESDFTVSPNPGNGFCFLSFNHKHKGTLQALVYNSNGSLVKEIQFNAENGRAVLDIKSLSADTYHIHIIDIGIVFTYIKTN